MDYSFVKHDLAVKGICESCENVADHVLVILEKHVVGVFQVCYDCSVMFEFGDKEYRVIPKNNAKLRNEQCTPMCNPRE